MLLCVVLAGTVSPGCPSPCHSSSRLPAGRVRRGAGSRGCGKASGVVRAVWSPHQAQTRDECLQSGSCAISVSLKLYPNGKLHMHEYVCISV